MVEDLNENEAENSMMISGLNDGNGKIEITYMGCNDIVHDFY